MNACHAHTHVNYHSIKAKCGRKYHIGHLIVLFATEDGTEELRLEGECASRAHVPNQILHL